MCRGQQGAVWGSRRGQDQKGRMSNVYGPRARCQSHPSSKRPFIQQPASIYSPPHLSPSSFKVKAAPPHRCCPPPLLY